MQKTERQCDEGQIKVNGECSAVDSCVTRVMDLGSEQACTDHASCLPSGNGFMCKCDIGYEMVDGVCVIDELQIVWDAALLQMYSELKRSVKCKCPFLIYAHVPDVR